MWSLVLLTGLAVLGVPGVLGVALDLTHEVSEDSVSWAFIQRFNFTKHVEVNTTERGWYAMNEFCVSEHSGTHFDAPCHFWPDGWKVGDVPLERLIVPGVMIDASSEALNNREFALQVSHIEAFERAHGALSSHGARIAVLVKFGWAQFYTNYTAYFGTANEDTSDPHFPGLSTAAAQKLLDAGNVVGLGVDSPSVDIGNNGGKYVVHQLLAPANIYNLENVAIPPELPETGFTLYVMPMKIAKGTGAPCRIVAVLNG